MPSKEIKELRQAGKLEEALAMAKSELELQPDNIWSKRNISWVYYEYIKQNSTLENVDTFIFWLKEVQNLLLPEEEKMLFEKVAWQIGSLVFKLANSNENYRYGKLFLIYEITKSFYFTKPSEEYSFLFKAFHKALKDTDKYISFTDWWNFENFREEDYLKEKNENGKEIMSIVEQAYIAYAKHLLPKQNYEGEIIFNKEKAEEFIPKLINIEEKHQEYQYPAFFIAKLLLAIGDKENMLVHLLPFAKKKRNDFWVWEVLAEAFSNETEKVFSCYCKALSCKSPEEMLIGLRQKLAKILINKNMFNEAKTEIELLVKARNEKGYRIPNEIVEWQLKDWYQSAIRFNNNFDFYNNYLSDAESILFYDVPEEIIIVDFVNSERKILNFIASDTKFGFFKYDRFFKDIKIGDVLKVRFQSGSNEGIYQLYTAIKTNDEDFKNRFLKAVDGQIKIQEGKSFGFLDDIFINPKIVTKFNLKDGMSYKGNAIKTYNKEKRQWGWKLI